MTENPLNNIKEVFLFNVTNLVGFVLFMFTYSKPWD